MLLLVPTWPIVSVHCQSLACVREVDGENDEDSTERNKGSLYIVFNLSV